MDPKHPAEVDPAKIVQAIIQEQVTNSFGSPTLWRIIGDHCKKNQVLLPTLKRVLCAGAPVPASLWNDSRHFLPNGLMHSPYGATEALPISSVDSSGVELKSLRGAHVGKALQGLEVRIIPIVDKAIAFLPEESRCAPNEIGEIVVRGPVVTKVYDALPEATDAAKIRCPDGSVWHRMGDTGFIDGKGELWFCGRKVERVRTPTGTLFTEPCERVFRQHPRAQRCALIGLGQPGQQRPALVAETQIQDSADARTLARELRMLAQEHEHTEGIKVFYFLENFPVDVRHNAKIHRLELRRWALTAVGYESDPKR